MLHGMARNGIGMRRIGIAASLLLLIAAAWTGLWFLAAREAGRQVDAWMDAEATMGRVLTCPDRTITGYPVALVVSCRHPLFAGESQGQGVRGSLAALTAEASLLHPRSLTLDLVAPFSYRTPDGPVDVTGTWTALRVVLVGVPTVGAMMVRGSDVAVDGQFGEGGHQGGRAAALDGTFTLAPDRADPALDFVVSVGAAPVPLLDALLGGTAPVDVALTGRLDKARADGARSPEEAMEAWRRAGGHIDLDASRLTRGVSQVTATGSLRLDDAHRPQGRLDAQVVGMEPILRRYGISGDLAGVTSLIGSLFGGRAQALTQPGALALPISLANGHVAVGPIRTPIMLPPLY